MNVQLIFFISVLFGVAGWSVVGAAYLWPWLRQQTRADALRPLLMLHVFRYIGLSFLVPGVVAADLPSTFARSTALGDLAAALLALLALASLRGALGPILVWIFNLWGTLDLLNAFFQAGAAGLSPGRFGAAFFLPTVIVPLLLVTHALAFRILLRPLAARSAMGAQ